MANSQAILAGFGLLASAILIVGLAREPAAAQPTGSWMISAVGKGAENHVLAAFKINTSTGQVFLCASVCTAISDR